jgi:dihydrofolate synthase/folylpolyglutamate synthase
MSDSRPFTSSAEIFDWLCQFINLEAGQIPKSFRPERMLALMEAAGHPERGAPVIHVAGSKGKGSVTGMIAAVLEEAGLNTLQFVSPHVKDYRERITRGRSYLDEKVYIAAGEELRRFTGSLGDKLGSARFLFEGSDPDSCPPTYFELLTLYFFLCAAYTRCDAMVVETGMGGRLDPTNVVDPLGAVITVIELEHTEFLGNTLTSVAGEKAGIIKRGKPLFLAAQSGEALEVFKKTAAQQEAPFYYFPDIVEINNLKVHEEGSDFTLSFKTADFFPDPPVDISIAIPGAVQAENAGLAILALKRCFPFIDSGTIQRGLKGFSLPARFERLKPFKPDGGSSLVETGSPLIIDGAHTARSVELTVETFCSLYGEGGVLVFGCASGKNAAAMASSLASRFSWIFITTPGTFKASDPDCIYEIFAGELRKSRNPGKLFLIPDTKKALAGALDAAAADSLPILGTGSFYLAAEIRNLVRR